MENLFHMFKCKYSILEGAYPKINIVNNSVSRRSEKIKILINLSDVLMTVLSYWSKSKLKIYPNIIFEGVLNICAHYKRFFKKSNWLISNNTRKKIEIYLYYSDEKYNIFNKNYNLFFDFIHGIGDTNFSNLIESLNLLTMVIKYIPGVYIINTKNIPSWLFPFDIIYKSDGDSSILLITNNPLDYSIIPLSSLLINVWKPRRSFLNKNNVFWTMMNVFPEDNIDTSIVFKHYPKLLSLGGVRQLNIPAALKTKTKNRFYEICHNINIDDIFKNFDLDALKLSDQEKNQYLENLEITDTSTYYPSFIYKIMSEEIEWKNDLFLDSLEHDIKRISENVNVYDLM